MGPKIVGGLLSVVGACGVLFGVAVAAQSGGGVVDLTGGVFTIALFLLPLIGGLWLIRRSQSSIREEQRRESAP